MFEFLPQRQDFLSEVLAFLRNKTQQSWVKVILTPNTQQMGFVKNTNINPDSNRLFEFDSAGSLKYSIANKLIIKGI
jgi:hypothetical protein